MRVTILNWTGILAGGIEQTCAARIFIEPSPTLRRRWKFDEEFDLPKKEAGREIAWLVADARFCGVSASIE